MPSQIPTIQIQTINLKTSTISLDLSLEFSFELSLKLSSELSLELFLELSLEVSLELSLELSLAKGPRILRCCQVDGLNQTDQYKVDPRLK